MDFNPIEIANNQVPVEKLVADIRVSVTPNESSTKLSDTLNSVYTGEENLFGGVGIKSQKQKLSMEDKVSIDETHVLVDDEWLAKYPTYKVGRDNAEYAAQMQSGLEQAFNGSLKAFNNIGAVVVGNTAGFVYGLGDWARTGNFNSVFDNSFSQTIDDWNTKLNYQLPNYYTKQSQEGGFLGQLIENPTNTIFNDIFNGLSFTVGTIASEAIWAYATGGASLAVRGGQLGARLANAGKWGKMFLGTEKAVDGLRAYKGFMAEPLKNAIRTGKISTGAAKALATTGSAINTARFIATSSGNEAGIEAFHFKKEATENFYHNFEQMYGRQPDAEEVANFTAEVEDAANGVFAANMAILGVSNLAMLGGLFGIKSPIGTLQKQINKKVFGVGVEKGATGWTAVAPTKWNKVARGLYIPTSATLREGFFEEAGQGVATKTANLWIERKYDPKYIDKAIDIMELAREAAKEQYLTPEGQKDIWIGAIVGLLGASATGEFSRFKREQKTIEESTVKAMNANENLKTTLVSDIAAGRISAVATQLEAQDRAERKMLEGDAVQAKLAQYDGLLAGFMLSDTYDDSARLVEDLSMAIDVSQDISSEEKDAFKTALTDLHNTYKKATSFAESIVGSQGRIYGTDKNSQLAKEALTFVLVQGNNANKLMQESFEEMKAYISEDHSKALKQSEDLTELGKDAKRRLKNASQRYKNLEKKSEQVQKRVQELQAAPKETEGDRSSRLVEMQNKLIEIESQKLEIRAEVDNLAKQLEQTNKLKSSLKETQESEVDNLGEFISTDDLLNLDDRLNALEEAYKSMEEFSPANAKMVKDAMMRYQNAKKALLDYNSAVAVIAKGNFKPKLANDNIFSKLLTKKANEKADTYTLEFFDAILQNRNAKGTNLMAVSQKSDAEKLEARKQELEAKETLTEEEQAELTQINTTLATLATPTTGKDDKPSRATVVEKKLAELNAQLQQLEKELENTPETETSVVGTKKTEIEKRIQEVKEKLGHPENVKRFDEFIELIKLAKSNLTQEQVDILLKGLNNNSVAIIGGTTDVNRNNVERGDMDTAWVENPSNLKGVELQEFSMALANLFKWIQSDNNTRQQPEVAEESGKGSISSDNLKVGGTNTNPIFIDDIVVNILSNKTDIAEAKKADIEKRRREEILNRKGNTISESEVERRFIEKRNSDSVQTKLTEGLNYTNGNVNSEKRWIDKEDAIFEELIAIGVKPDNRGVIDNTAINKAFSENESKIRKEVNDEIKQEGLKRVTDEFRKQDDTVKFKEINAKYDAELKALEEQPTAQEQPNPRTKELKTQITNLKREISRLSPQTQETPTDTVEALKQRIDNILKMFKAEFVGMDNIEEKIKNKPDQKDIERYRELLAEGQETEEFQELKEKLSKWRVYDSLVENDNESIADLLDQVAVLETKVDEIETITDAAPEFDNSADLDTNKSGKVDNFSLTQNTNFPPTLKVKDNGTIILTHLKVPTLLAKFQNAENVKVNGEETDLQDLKQGDKITFDDNGLKRSFTIGTGMSIELAKEDFLAIPNLITSNNLTDKITNWSYSVLYEVNANSEAVPMVSGFADEMITGHTNNLKQGDTVEFYVDINHPYNQQLLAEKNKTNLINNVVIFIRKNGENYQTLKSLQGRTTNDNVKTIREAAAKQLKTGKSGQIGTTTVERVELGVPILTLTVDGAITSMPITERGATNIIATGFIQDGEITLNKEVEDVRKSYVSKSSKREKGKKVPIVIIKQGKQNIAFPVKMIKTSNPQGDKMQEVFNNENLSDAQKVVAINQLLVDNSIPPRRFDLTNLAQTEKLQQIEEALNSVESFKTADNLANKDYKSESLVNDAEISLDLENLDVYLPSQKILISFEDVNLKEIEAVEKVKKQNEPRAKVVSAKVVKQTKEKVNIRIENEEALEQANKSSKLKGLNLKVGDNPIVVEKEEAKKLKRYTTTEKQTISKVTVKPRESFPTIEIDEDNVEEVVKVDDALAEKRAQQIANTVFKSGAEVLEGEMLEDYKKDAGYINKLANDMKEQPQKTVTVKPKQVKTIENILPNVSIDYSEYEVGAVTNLYKKEDGNWYFKDSRGQEQRESQKNKVYLDWILEEMGQGQTLTNQEYKDKKQEFNQIQELEKAENDIQC